MTIETTKKGVNHMALLFIAPPQLQLYCRFCKKTVSATLERSIAESGKDVDRESTFEYVCSSCRRPDCYYGKDLVEAPQPTSPESIAPPYNPRPYNITQRFLVGEKIIHPSYKSIGIVVGKYPGVPTRLIVKFEKNIVSLVEGIDN